MRKRGIIAYSSGNHAQAIAYAATLQGVAVDDRHAVGRAGHEGGRDQGLWRRGRLLRPLQGGPRCDQPAACRRKRRDAHSALRPSRRDRRTGTATLELCEEVGELDLLVAPLGGGGLLAGSALAIKAMSPNVRSSASEPEAGNDGQQSLAQGRGGRIPIPKSIADGALTPSLGDHNFPIIKSNVERIVTVSDEQLIDTLRFFAERMKILVEPTGCLAAAGDPQRRHRLQGQARRDRAQRRQCRSQGARRLPRMSAHRCGRELSPLPAADRRQYAREG